MKILYGVVGEGMGHATRSRVVIEHLLAVGHEVEVVVSGRAHDMLKDAFANVQGTSIHRIHGLHVVYEDNEVQRRLTLLSNIEALGESLPQNIATYQGTCSAVSMFIFNSGCWMHKNQPMTMRSAPRVTTSRCHVHIKLTLTLKVSGKFA